MRVPEIDIEKRYKNIWEKFKGQLRVCLMKSLFH